MSVLTKTALTYAGVFGIFLVLVMLLVSGREEMTTKSFSGMSEALWALLIISGSWAFLFELIYRKVRRINLQHLSLRVSVFQIGAQLFMVLYLFGVIIQYDKWGLSYVLFALSMLYTVLFLKKKQKDKAFWLVNVCCTIVINSTLLTFLLVVTISGRLPMGVAEQGESLILKIILSGLIFGGASYLNYRQLIQE